VVVINGEHAAVLVGPATEPTCIALLDEHRLVLIDRDPVRALQDAASMAPVAVTVKAIGRLGIPVEAVRWEPLVALGAALPTMLIPSPRIAL
jgi:hypothetical protein